MKNLLKEEKKLPLTFKYIEHFRTKKKNKINNSTASYVLCKKYQTDYLLRENPIKPLTRLL
ncbi:hypothetical protein QF044_004334 [Chryseobacterium sp. W4I1]|nr:hypothetical protein [Chryseobacterium sp. W4I1]